MELLDTHTGRSGRGEHVSYETFEFEHAGQAVLRPHRGWQAAAIRPDQDELHLVAEPRLQALGREPGLDSAERAATARRDRCAVLFEELPWRPRQSVAEGAKRRQIDTHTLVADNADALGERDAGLIDRKTVPDGAGTETGFGESGGPAQRHGLGVDQPGWVDDRTDHRLDPAGFEPCERRCGRGCDTHGFDLLLGLEVRELRPPRGGFGAVVPHGFPLVPASTTAASLVSRSLTQSPQACGSCDP